MNRNGKSALYKPVYFITCLFYTHVIGILDGILRNLGTNNLVQQWQQRLVFDKQITSRIIRLLGLDHLNSNAGYKFVMWNVACPDTFGLSTNRSACSHKWYNSMEPWYYHHQRTTRFVVEAQANVWLIGCRLKDGVLYIRKLDRTRQPTRNWHKFDLDSVYHKLCVPRIEKIDRWHKASKHYKASQFHDSNTNRMDHVNIVLSGDRPRPDRNQFSKLFFQIVWEIWKKTIKSSYFKWMIDKFWKIREDILKIALYHKSNDLSAYGDTRFP